MDNTFLANIQLMHMNKINILINMFDVPSLQHRARGGLCQASSVQLPRLMRRKHKEHLNNLEDVVRRSL